VDRLLLVTQTPPYLKKHPGGDRTGDHTKRAKVTADMYKIINDGLIYYEQDLWNDFEGDTSLVGSSIFHIMNIFSMSFFEFVKFFPL
jgi:la-related protein 1